MNRYIHKYTRPFGLKWSRMLGWVRDVWAEKPGLHELIYMAEMALHVLIHPVNSKTYHARLLQCRHCPIYNKSRKSCRNGNKGCGCYLPYKALSPKATCWLCESHGLKGWVVRV